MKLAQFTTKNSSRPLLGLRRGGVVVDVTEVAPDLNAVINGGSPVIAALNGYSAGAAYALEAIDYLPAVRPSKIVAIGRNYYDHAVEGGSEPPASPLLFTKLPNSLSAHLAPIVLPAISAQVDYEAELAVIIGRRARQVREEEALDYIFGYTLINDVSARDLQFGDGQWVRGKGLDTFAPLGPFITTKDEIADVQKLKI
jgi:2-keto-4-pentenoate hydratase/2-oxohepta-3-ene-1,7-dioic acid hydratase in catechol pathway